MTEPNRPRPRPADAAAAVPDGGIDVVLPEPRTPGGGSRRPRRLKKTRRFLKTRRGKWTVVAVAAVIALLAGLLSSGFLSPAAPSLKDAPAIAGAGTDDPGFGTDTPVASATTGAGGPATAQDIKKALQDKVGSVDNPLNHLRSPGKHRVAIAVTSSQPIQTIGYLVPTSINTDYAFGTAKPKRTSWSLNTDAVGSGYLAAVFVQAGGTGAPVRCVVTIDGKTTNSETTGGKYGRQVCLG